MEKLFVVCAPGLEPFLAQELDGVHDVLLLVHEGLSEILRPVQPLVHAVEDLRELDEALNAGIPRLGLDGLLGLRGRKALPELNGRHDRHGIG